MSTWILKYKMVMVSNLPGMLILLSTLIKVDFVFCVTAIPEFCCELKFRVFSIVLNLLYVHPKRPMSTNPIRNIRLSEGVRKKKLFPYFTNEQMESSASGKSCIMADDANDFLISCADTVAAFHECDGHSLFHKSNNL